MDGTELKRSVVTNYTGQFDFCLTSANSCIYCDFFGASKYAFGAT